MKREIQSCQPPEEEQLRKREQQAQRDRGGNTQVYSRYSTGTNGVRDVKFTRDEPGTFGQVWVHTVTHRPWKSIGFYSECDANPRGDFEQGMHHLISI